MPERGRLVAVEGASAAGKSTLVRRAAERLGWTPVTEAFDRLDPAPSLDFETAQELLRLEGTLLAEECRRYRESRRYCERGATVLTDTGFLGPLTYTWGLFALGRAPRWVAERLSRSTRALARTGRLGLPDLTVYLDTPQAVRRLRAREDPGRHPPALAPRHESVGRLERRYYQDRFPARLPERFRTVSGRPEVARRIDRIAQLVEAAPTTPATSAEAVRLLSALPFRRRDSPRPTPRPNR